MNTIFSKNLNKMKKVFSFIKKLFTHNLCDDCGFTQDNVYITEYYSEGGLIQCMKCYNENFKSK